MVFGVKKLPEIERLLSEGIREFKAASHSFYQPMCRKLVACIPNYFAYLKMIPLVACPNCAHKVPIAVAQGIMLSGDAHQTEEHNEQNQTDSQGVQEQTNHRGCRGTPQTGVRQCGSRDFRPISVAR
ncbi:twin-arginine translocase TatA/TatE family subunit [bacterium]|nr:twin-arginine translocase TatA/TatE family subunit [bacterium]